MTSWISALKSVVEGMSMTFLHADPYEANLGLDDIKDAAFPVFVLIAPVKLANKVTDAGLVTRKVPVFGFLLNRIPELETVHASKERARSWIDSSILGGDHLVGLLNKNPITWYDKDNGINGIEDYSSDETYAKFDGNLYGIAMTFTWPVSEGIKSC